MQISKKNCLLITPSPFGHPPKGILAVPCTPSAFGHSPQWGEKITEWMNFFSPLGEMAHSARGGTVVSEELIKEFHKLLMTKNQNITSVD